MSLHPPSLPTLASASSSTSEESVIEENSDEQSMNRMKNSRAHNLPLSKSSFIKTPSSPSLSFRMKKTNSINDVLNLESKLDIYCKNDVEKLMLYLVGNKFNVMGILGLLYLLGTLYCLKDMSLMENLLNILLFLVQMINNRHNINMVMSYGETFRKMDDQEKITTLVSVLVYTCRFFLFPRHRTIFLPIVFMWFAGSNGLYISSTFWGLLPTYFLTFLYLGSMSYSGYFEYTANGYTTDFLDIITDHCMLFGCVWMFSYYMVNVTGFLKHKVDKLLETRKRLESALEARSRFMAHISHEFRCPIMSSIGCLELLKETDLNDKQNDLVDTIVSSNSILLLLIEDILQIVKIEHENKETKKEEDLTLKSFNLFESLKSMKGIIVGYASNFKVNLSFDIDDRIKEMFVLANASKLHQILSNLLTNAVKASNQNGEVCLKCQLLEETGEKARVRFICRDNGCGIPQHLIASIFEPFVQLENNSQSKVPSSGLGLTTVSHLIKSMDGTISVQSEVGKGSTFTVDLPFKLIQDNVPETDQKSKGEDKRIKLHLNVHRDYLSMMTDFERTEKEKQVKKPNFDSKILIAEDNPINRKVIVKMINSLGHNTDYVCDGKELVENFNPQTHKVVITDMNMPNMNGLEASRILRQKYGKSFKIYLLTGNVTISLSELDEIGIIDGILTKPCSKQDLNKCLLFD